MSNSQRCHLNLRQSENEDNVRVTNLLERETNLLGRETNLIGLE